MGRIVLYSGDKRQMERSSFGMTSIVVQSRVVFDRLNGSKDRQRLEYKFMTESDSIHKTIAVPVTR